MARFGRNDRRATELLDSYESRSESDRDAWVEKREAEGAVVRKTTRRHRWRDRRGRYVVEVYFRAFAYAADSENEEVR